MSSRTHHVSGYSLGVGQTATGGFTQGSDKFESASRPHDGQAVLIAFRWW
jgi:hypothetical protein